MLEPDNSSGFQKFENHQAGDNPEYYQLSEAESRTLNEMPFLLLRYDEFSKTVDDHYILLYHHIAETLATLEKLLHEKNLLDRATVIDFLVEICKMSRFQALSKRAYRLLISYCMESLYDDNINSGSNDYKLTPKEAGRILSQLIDLNNSVGIPMLMNNLEILFNKWNLNFIFFIRIWKRGIERSAKRSDLLALKKNLLAVIELETSRPGSVMTLAEEFGIRHFGRYPIEVLIHQYDSRDMQNPYGVIVNPVDDYNGAFYNDRELFASFFDQLGGCFELRVLEAESKFDLARALILLRDRYPEHKISFCIIGGHGSKHSIQFGGTKKKNYLFASDLKGRSAGRVSEFFEPGVSIVLVSCSTGKQGGIGQELSEVMDCRVIGPKTSTNISSLSIDLFNKPPRLNARYSRKREENVFTSGNRGEQNRLSILDRVRNVFAS